jgi:hypothetical protein
VKDLRLGIGLALGLLFAGTAFVRAQQGAERPAVLKGVNWLRGQVGGLWTGEAALVALTFNKSELPVNDPAMATCVQKMLQRFSQSGYAPERESAPGIYECAVTIMALANIDPVGYKPYVEAAMQWMVAQQRPGGGWDYTERTAGDASISQYAILGLWEAEGIGASVPPQVWDRAAAWFISVQYDDGGWRYHHDEPQWRETVSMTAAGVGSLLVCQRQLARYRRGIDAINPLMTPLVVEGAAPLLYAPKTPAGAVNNAIKKGYGVERIGALADRSTLGGADWFARGESYILGRQDAAGPWKDYHGDVPNTCWAILFVVKATAKSVHKIEIRRLGAGTLLGGRGLPSNLNELTIAQGRVMVRPMSGAVESMVSVLEDPRALSAEAALGGLIEKYRADGPKVLRPYKDRFRKLLSDKDSSIRQVAAWALGRTEDMDVVPMLIDRLNDPVEDVMTEAKLSLQFLSRKIDGYGPPIAPTPEQRAEAIRQWKIWFAETRPPELDIDVEPELAREAAKNAAAAKPAAPESGPAVKPVTAPRPPGGPPTPGGQP